MHIANDFNRLHLFSLLFGRCAQNSFRLPHKIDSFSRLKLVILYSIFEMSRFFVVIDDEFWIFVTMTQLRLRRVFVYADFDIFFLIPILLFPFFSFSHLFFSPINWLYSLSSSFLKKNIDLTLKKRQTIEMHKKKVVKCIRCKTCNYSDRDKGVLAIEEIFYFNIIYWLFSFIAYN